MRPLAVQVLREPCWVLPAEVLHGLTFAAMWAATTSYAYEIAPGEAVNKLLVRTLFKFRGTWCIVNEMMANFMSGQLGTPSAKKKYYTKQQNNLVILFRGTQTLA